MSYRRFEGNFGNLSFFYEDSMVITGKYGSNGSFRGKEIAPEKYNCIWNNNGEEGLLTIEIIDGKLEGKWKRGIEPGRMSGKWSGVEIFTNPEWSIIHDLGCFYIFFGNLAENAAQEAEIKFVNKILRKWTLTVEGIEYQISNYNSEEINDFFDMCYNALYIDEHNKPNKSPFIQINASHANLIEYFNTGVFLQENAKTLYFSIFQLCEINGFTNEQLHQLEWFVNHWLPFCPKLDSVSDLIQLAKDYVTILDLDGSPISEPNFFNKSNK